MIVAVPGAMRYGMWVTECGYRAAATCRMSGLHHLDFVTGRCNACDVQLLAPSRGSSHALEGAETKAEGGGVVGGSAPPPRRIR